MAGPLFPEFFAITGYGAMRNMHLLIADRLRPAARWLADRGGLNRHGEPNYRLVWGWERPHLYGISDGQFLEYFHLERWMGLEAYQTDDEWDREQQNLVRLSGGKHEPLPYPKHGEYFEVKVCEYGMRQKDGTTRSVFRWPDSDSLRVPGLRWYQQALYENLERRERTRAQIADQVAEDQKLLRQQEIENTQRVLDRFGVRELADTEAEMLARNPSLRSDPTLMFSPAIQYRRTKHRIPRSTF